MTSTLTKTTGQPKDDNDNHFKNEVTQNFCQQIHNSSKKFKIHHKYKILQTSKNTLKIQKFFKKFKILQKIQNYSKITKFKSSHNPNFENLKYFKTFQNHKLANSKTIKKW